MFNLYALINIKDIINTFGMQGCTCKEFTGGCWPLGTDFLQKMILQRHHATEAQTYISILMVDAPYFYRHCLSYYISIVIVFRILAIKEVAIF